MDNPRYLGSIVGRSMEYDVVANDRHPQSLSEELTRLAD